MKSDAADLVQQIFLTWAAKGQPLRDATKATYSEIVAILEIPLGTVQSGIARGVPRLKARVLGGVNPAGKPEEKVE